MIKNFIFIFLIVLTGCQKQIFLYKDANKFNGNIDVSLSDTHHFVFYGIAQERIIDAPKICGGKDKVIAVETLFGSRDFLFGYLISLPFYMALPFIGPSIGGYMPRSYKVYCEKV